MTLITLIRKPVCSRYMRGALVDQFIRGISGKCNFWATPENAAGDRQRVIGGRAAVPMRAEDIGNKVVP
jgi:hypothetical protein